MDFPEIWDEQQYIARNPEVEKLLLSKKIKTGWDHFQRCGIKEKKPPTWVSNVEIRKKCNVNYVIATWSGQRREGNDQHIVDATYYLSNHLKSLHTYKHGLAQITIAVPENPTEPPAFTEYLKNIPETIQGTPVVIIRRKNVGQSYGSYSDVFLKYGEQFNYYILIEDDYVFVIDDFDITMITELEIQKDCSYLCSYVGIHDHKAHAAISNGIAKASILTTVIKKYGKLPYGPETVNYAVAPQLEFSLGFPQATQKKLWDLAAKYRAPFNDGGKLKFFGFGPDLIVPLQFLDQLRYRV